MKKLLLIAGITGTLFTSGCCHKETGKAMTVIRDCTGTYLRMEDKDYLVCNVSITVPYGDGARVMASFKRLSSCKDLADKTICQMYHANEGWIQVLSIH